ncbi:RimK family alpha-L-glutamate ligase [Salinibaculum rarum]|uniref:RimK family alpha-L-glutamate ligase n=1 Tax=Salinibaculum rarum TaxID=3058903 RepID=UPI002660055D|nr:RimK family alpha-L-glutamate ligase [Salinibaculum sp. KK48]
MSADTDSITVGLLGLHSSKESKAILNAAEALGHDTEWLRRENTAVNIQNGDLALEPDVDVVANRLLLSTSTHPAEELGLARLFDHVRPMLNRPAAVTTAMHKFATAAALTEADIPVPDALLALSGDRLNDARKQFGEQAVYKTAIGTHGGGAWKVDLDDPVNPRVGDRQAFLQRFVDSPGDARDARVYIVDGEIIGAMYRHAPEGEWRTNVSLGSDVHDATDDLPETAKEMAIGAAEAIGLDYAGVDLIENDDGWVVLEANPTAGFRGLYKATGTSPAPYIAKLAIERAGGTVDDERVKELAGTLDDSTPACMPQKKRTTPSKPGVIGFIEDVVVSGTRGSQNVLAKSDTGATRTSIDSQLAAEIGTGPIKDIVHVRSGSVKSGKARPVVDVVVGVGGTQHTVSASVEDRGHMDYQLLLGRDILEHYHVDVTRSTQQDNVNREE